MDHIRIDEGVKRGKRNRLVPRPNEIEKEARNKAGQFLARYSPELKAKAIEQGLATLECGGRIEDVATQLDIPVATMYSWLIGHDAGTARTLFFDGQCAATLVEIKTAPSPLELARAREYLSGWLKVAERRDPKNYGQKIQQTVEIVDNLEERLDKARKRVIDITPVADVPAAQQQITDNSDKAL